VKKANAEFLRDYYSSFTLDYEHVVEQLFMTRVYLVASVGCNLLLAGVLIVVALV
jgi:hypothetical protein